MMALTIIDDDELSNIEEYTRGANPLDRDTDRNIYFDGDDAFPTRWQYAFDSDSDGLPDRYEASYSFLDLMHPGDAQEDSDADGLSNVEEFRLGLDLLRPDSDGDGVNDSVDVALLDTSYALDSNQDGLPDTFEIQYPYLSVSNPLDAGEGFDFDFDGWSNFQEFHAGTDIDNPDSDGDGRVDGDDIEPLNSAYSIDENLDGIPDEWQLEYNLTIYPPDVHHPFEDTDLDGLSDLREYQLGTNPTQIDTDYDGFPDGQDRFPLDMRYHADSDGDGMPDAWENQAGLSAQSSADAGFDLDSDGLRNYFEFLAGTDPLQADSDNDGVIDSEDSHPADSTQGGNTPPFVFTQSTDIGFAGTAGYFSYDDLTGLYSVFSGGVNIGGWEDHFHYVFAPAAGDVDIQLRVVSIFFRLGGRRNYVAQ